MSASALATSQHDHGLAVDLIAHLELQIASAERLLRAILDQGAAVRRRDVDGVLAHLSDVRVEMDQRGLLEAPRAALLERAGAVLGVPAASVTLEAIAALMAPADAARARGLSAKLRGLLAEIVREHGVNRALMRQELAFLEHLVRLIGHEEDTGYGPVPPIATGPRRRVLDLEA